MVKIYSKDYCPYCMKAKSLLGELGIQYKEIDVTHKPDVMREIAEKSGFTTVPQIFVEEKCLGGYTDIAKLNDEGQLVSLCK